MSFLPLVIVALRAHVQRQLGIETLWRKQGENAKEESSVVRRSLKRKGRKRKEREFLCKRNFKRDEVEGKCE
jgi:hypothetical protein